MTNPDRELTNTLVGTIDGLLDMARENLKDIVNGPTTEPVDLTEITEIANNINTMIELRNIVEQGLTSMLDQAKYKNKMIEVLQFHLDMEN